MASSRQTLALFVLVLTVIALTEGIRGAGPKNCCPGFNERPVARDRVVSYIRTSQRCSKPAIRLKTVAGRSRCVRPSAVWVKELISYLDAKPFPGETTNL